ncbi:MAG: hypothetical protein LBH40_05435 [Alphaproteobacteria bacterium]|nr:hypothetical protein [Alphaproteobacteria bacterium]
MDSLAYVSNIVLEATAKGDTQEQAVNNALNLLSQQIYVSLQNTTTINETLKNEDFSSNVENNTVLNSAGFFQNISIYNTKKISRDSYQATVGLSPQALADSIDYLFLQLNPQQVKGSSKIKIQEQLDMANFLISLINYAEAKQVAYQKHELNLKEYINDLNKILNADSQLRFLIHPQDAKAKISINNKIYNGEEIIYLNGQKYLYKVTAQGFKEATGETTLYKGDKLTLDIYLQKQLFQVIPVKIKIINESDIQDSVVSNNLKSLLSQNQMKYVEDSLNYIEVMINQKVAPSVIKGYTNNLIEVRITSNIENKLKSAQFNINNLTDNPKQKVSANIFTQQFNQNSQIFFARLFD